MQAKPSHVSVLLWVLFQPLHLMCAICQHTKSPKAAAASPRASPPPSPPPAAATPGSDADDVTNGRVQSPPLLTDAAERRSGSTSKSLLATSGGEEEDDDDKDVASVAGDAAAADDMQADEDTPEVEDSATDVDQGDEEVVEEEEEEDGESRFMGPVVTLGAGRVGYRLQVRHHPHCMWMVCELTPNPLPLSLSAPFCTTASMPSLATTPQLCEDRSQPMWRHPRTAPHGSSTMTPVCASWRKIAFAASWSDVPTLWPLY